MVPLEKLVFNRLGLGIACAGLFVAVACGGSSSEDKPSSGGSGGAAGGGGASGSGAVSSGGSGGTTSSGGSAGSASGGAAGTSGVCYPGVYDGLVYVNYEQFSPKLNGSCAGTNHQDIQNPEKLVFLGDSITVGTFPTPANQVYRTLLTNLAKAQWPSIEVASCAVNGAQTDDFFAGDNQIPKCFPAAEQKKTLVVITMGGNDIAAMAKDKLSASAASVEADKVLANMKQAVEWLKDPTNFPNGSWVVFANIYEYTDLTADLGSCPTGNLIGLTGEWIAGTAMLVKLREGYMKIAVDAQADMIFLGEHFCGHGYKFADTKQQCYIPNSSNWFDLTCIHPTPEGHKQVADLFWKTIAE
ncbi:MAG: SGNH/GDSL hydrolase family protein [Polyangiaceae bacterium]|nr:SGNH/GDSL hydrolase family protein [Polyangiaceae bacterium]MCL4756236.1 SGNH/GDSL hydrolase family protein [Myxococcales bacterium]